MYVAHYLHGSDRDQMLDAVALRARRGWPLLCRPCVAYRLISLVKSASRCCHNNRSLS